MNQLLFTIGIFVFMFTVYGTVVIGGHLLKLSRESDAATRSIAESASEADRIEPAPSLVD